MTNGHRRNGSDAAAITGTSVLICGAGGHAKVVADVLRSGSPLVDVKGFLDDRVELHGTELCGLPVLGGLDEALNSAPVGGSALLIGIGDNRARERVAGKASQAGFKFATGIHASAQIGSEVEIGEGSVLMANVVVNASSVIGSHVIVNTSATVDHDCVVEDFSHISPGVNLAGGVTVGRGAHVGIGASVIPGVRIGEWSKVGAGAAVMADVPPFATVVGNPAESLRSRVKRSTAK